jgi:hypothetical protein
MQQRSGLAEWLKYVGIALVLVALLVRVGIGLYVVGSDPSQSLLSWQAVGRVLSAYRTDGVMPPAARSAVAVAAVSGLALWGLGLVLGRWRKPS